MTLVQRYTNTTKGALLFTGNTLGFSGTVGSAAGIGAFLSTVSGLNVAGYPTPSTSDWTQNGSTAILSLPANSIIEYAELIWGGSAINDTLTLPNSTLDTSVTFKTPLGNNTISPDPITSTSTFLLGLQRFYTRSQNVTTIVKTAGLGTYEVDGVPGVLNPSPGSTSSAGWLLAVAYTNTTLPYSNLNLYVGNVGIQNGSPPVDTTVSGFSTPSSGAVNGRVLISAMEGNSAIVGDAALFGPSTGSLTTLTGPNNPASNFFCSQINNSLGVLDTTGSFGNLNQPVGSAAPAVRSCWDITNVNASSALTNSQTSGVVRLTTTGDAYAVSTLGLQIQVQSADLRVIKSVNKQFTTPGDTLTYTISFTNNGLVNADNALLIDTIPNSTSFVNGSINSTQPFTGTNPQSGLTFTNPIAPNTTVTVTYNVVIQSTLPNPNTIPNVANIGYTFVSAPSLPRINASETSNTVITTVNQAEVSTTKFVFPSNVGIGDTITYTIRIVNTGNLTVNNVSFVDTLPSGTVLASGSSNPNPPSSIPVGTLAPGGVFTVTFRVITTTLPSSGVIPNFGSSNFVYTIDPSLPNGSSGISNSNTVITNVKQAIVNSIKSVDKQFAMCGDTLTYTILVSNSGNTDARDIVLIDTIPSSTSLVINSVVVNGVSLPGANLISGITIPNIPSGSSATVTFRVNIIC